jgi:hypothetical protein
MAKTNGENGITLSKAHAAALAALKRPVTAAAASFGTVREKLSELAPKVLKLFTNITAGLEEGQNFTFVDFCRMFDASIPTHAADRDGVIGYRNHRVYYTLAYMRRLAQTAGTQRKGQQGVRDSATDALARTLATILQIVDDKEAVWSAVQKEMAFTERLMTRLRKRVDATKPFIKLTASTPAKVGGIIHYAPAPAAANEGAGEPMAQPGRRITLPAPSEGPRAVAGGRKRAAA